LRVPVSLRLLAVSLILGGCAQSPTRDAGLAGEGDAAYAGESAKPDWYSLYGTPGLPDAPKGQFMSVRNDLWGRMSRAFILDEIDNERVQTELRWYQDKAEYLSKVSQRAEPYLHFIVEQLEARQLPVDLALLPIVESAYRPEALSSSQAAGIWQFIPSTGKHFGLQQSWWYDGRRDVHASTLAAMDYFERLSRMFNGDWVLVLAAYNGGEGTIQRAIDRNAARGLPTDFWSLEGLSDQTRAYPAKLIALSRVFTAPEVYGLNLHPIVDAPYLERIAFDGALDLDKVARETDTPADELYRLNPGFRYAVTGPNHGGHLLVPRERAYAFNREALARAREDLGKWRTHKVMKGETLPALARRYQVEVAELKRVNQLDSASLKPGSQILVPARAAALPVARSATGQPTANRAAQVHTVRSGESAWSIARQYGLKPDELLAMNGLGDKATLNVGQTLVIEQGKPAAPAARVQEKSATARTEDSRSRASEKQYIVERGDTLFSVARKFNLTLADLRTLNGLSESATLRPGQPLLLR
jgi:membrane-bound lytic murein transglycosylase D